MKQFIIVTFLTISILLLNTHSFFAQEEEYYHREKFPDVVSEDQSANVNAEDNNGENIYQCQIDLEVLSNSPRRCSKCGLILKKYTMEEVINNLVEHGFIKPTLKNKNVLMVEAEVDTLIEEIVDTTAHIDNMPEIDFLALDHDENGKVFQCLNCPVELDDDKTRCRICNELLKEFTIEEAKANLNALATRAAKAQPEAEENPGMKDQKN